MLNKTFQYTAEKMPYKGYQIQTYRFGNGPIPILSIPSFPHSGIYYVLFTRYYDYSKFTVYTLDLPGWAGYSDNVFENKKFELEKYIEIIEAMIKYYRLDKFSLVGYSYGGALALIMANLYIKKIRKLVLISPVYNGNLLNGSREKILVRLAKILRLKTQLKKVILKEMLGYREAFTSVFGDNLFEQYYGMLDSIDKDIAFSSLEYLFNSDLTNELIKLKDFPNILIVNSKDEKSIFRKQAESIRKILTSEQSFKIHGSHDDFIVHPNGDNVKKIVEYLLG